MREESDLTRAHHDSELVCAVCGLRVLRISNGWRHASGGRALSCGRKPEPARITTKARFDAEMDSVRRALERNLGPR